MRINDAADCAATAGTLLQARAPRRGGAVQIRTAVQENWRELRAVEQRADAFSEEFEGEDVLHPSVRERLDEAKSTLTVLHGDVQKYAGPFELPEPNEELTRWSSGSSSARSGTCRRGSHVHRVSPHDATPGQDETGVTIAEPKSELCTACAADCC